ncbi:MAG: hypothetical protein WC071_02465 [Victivallaceae bacterium]
MKSVKLFFITVAAATILSGCKSTEVDSKPQDKQTLKKIEQNEQAQVKKIADGYAADMLKGLKDENHALFVKNMTPEMKEQITPKVFKNMIIQLKEKLGTYQSAEYLTELNRILGKVYVWKALFNKKITGKDKKEITAHNEMLFKIIIGKVDKDKYVVLGFYFE